MEHLFIVNPVAGRVDRTSEVRAAAERALSPLGEQWSVAVTERRGHATELARAACETGREIRLYACGGDGTLNEVVNGAAGFSNAAVTSIPLGTGNDFIKLFGEGAKLFKSMENLVGAPQRALDLIECGGRYSLNICSVGFDARIGTQVHKYTGLPLVSGKGAYGISVVVNVIKGIHLPYEVEVDGRRLNGRYTMLVCCNGRYYGGGFCPVPEAEPDDGLLDFLLVSPVSRFTVPKVIGKFAKGRHSDFPKLFTYLRGKSMTVTADRISPVNVDGEQLDLKTFTFCLSEKKVNFFFPEKASWDNMKAEETAAI